MTTYEYVEGFDHLAVADLLSKYTNAGMTTLGYTIVAGHDVGNALRMTGGGSREALLRTLPGGALKTRVISFSLCRRVNPGGTVGVLGLFDGTSRQSRLVMQTTGVIGIQRGTTALVNDTQVFTIDQYYNVVWLITIGAATGSSGTWGAYSLYIDGVLRLSATNVNTQSTANATADTLGYEIGTGGTLDIDHVLVMDAVTHGRRVLTLTVTGAGASTQHTPVGAGSNYQCVDDSTPNGDTDYIESGTVGHVDTFAMQNVSGGPTGVEAVAVTVTARKPDAVARSIRPILRVGSTNYDGGSDKALTTAAFVHQTVWNTNPATSSAWTTSDVDAAEAGVKVSA